LTQTYIRTTQELTVIAGAPIVFIHEMARVYDTCSDLCLYGMRMIKR